ncbi:hypothetical protein P8452_34236 [Trifolium repens]|nr:hypothetical protein P8452_34236 [Trifolium repens]
MADIANLSIIPLMPTSFAPDSKEIAFKTIPSASKFQIKHFIESFYNLQFPSPTTFSPFIPPSTTITRRIRRKWRQISFRFS